MFSKISQISQENTCDWVSFLIKFQAWSHLTEHLRWVLLKNLLTLQFRIKFQLPVIFLSSVILTLSQCLCNTSRVRENKRALVYKVVRLSLSAKSKRIVFWFAIFVCNNMFLLIKKALNGGIRIFGPPSYGGSYKITIACLSVGQFGIFLVNGSLVFCDFWHDGR